VTELANFSAVYPKDPGSNLRGHKIFSDFVSVGFEYKCVGP
jgi:hypothetical protein